MKKIFRAIGIFFKNCASVLLAGLMTLGVGLLEIVLFPFVSIFLMIEPKKQKE